MTGLLTALGAGAATFLKEPVGAAQAPTFNVQDSAASSAALAAATDLLLPANMSMQLLTNALATVEANPDLLDLDPAEAEAQLNAYENGCDAGAALFVAVVVVVLALTYVMPGRPESIESVDEDLLNSPVFGGTAQQLLALRAVSARILLNRASRGNGD